MKYSEIAAINVNEHVEKKNNLSYLSWAWAVDQLQRLDGNAKWFYAEPTIYLNGTMMVYCTVVAFGRERTAQLPVMDYKNKAIQEPDAFQVNTAIMRCLAKGIALHGLGLYIYAGEDLPEDGSKPEPEAYVKLIEESKNVTDLQSNWKAAYQASQSDAGFIAAITVAKDKRKAELSAA